MSQGKFCEGCGQPLAPGLRFCEHCGRPTVPGAAPAAPPAHVTPAAPASSMSLLIAFAAIGLVGAVAVLTFAAIHLLRPKLPGPGTVTDGQTTTASADPTRPPTDKQPPKPPNNPPDGTTGSVDSGQVITDPSINDEASSGSTSGISDTTGTPLDEARTYLPQPGFKYSYYYHYADGDQGPESETVGRPSERVLATVVRAVPAEGETIYYSEHFAQGPDGVVRAWDDQPDGTEAFMPDGLQVGKSWVSPGMRAEVVAMGESIDLGFVRFDDAMLVHYVYEADYEETRYYVPGYGEVYSVTPGGLVAKKLTNVSAVDAGTLAAVMKKHAPNAGKVN